jgi:hypothetical protein
MNFFELKKLLENKRIAPLAKQAKKADKHVVFSFGRNQPPTAGHGHVINHVVQLARQAGADHVVFTSGTGPTHKVKAMRDKNPLHPEEKVEIMRDFFPGANIQHHQEVLSPFHAIDKLKEMGYTHATMVVGADRLHELGQRMAPYGGTNFRSFKVVSPGEQRIDVNGKEVSGTAARKHAARNDYSSFREIMPAEASENMVKKLFSRLRKPVATPVTKKKKKKKKTSKKRIVESIFNFLMEQRPRTAKEKTRAYYKKEYRDHQSSPKAIKERGQRWTARRRAAVNAAKRKLGAKAESRTRDQLIKLGQRLLKGKDVDHKRALSKGGSNDNNNTRVVSRSYNRSRNNN